MKLNTLLQTFLSLILIERCSGFDEDLFESSYGDSLIGRSAEYDEADDLFELDYRDLGDESGLDFADDLLLDVRKRDYFDFYCTRCKKTFGTVAYGRNQHRRSCPYCQRSDAVTNSLHDTLPAPNVNRASPAAGAARVGARRGQEAVVAAT